MRDGENSGKRYCSSMLCYTLKVSIKCNFEICSNKEMVISGEICYFNGNLVKDKQHVRASMPIFEIKNVPGKVPSDKIEQTGTKTTWEDRK